MAKIQLKRFPRVEVVLREDEPAGGVQRKGVDEAELYDTEAMVYAVQPTARFIDDDIYSFQGIRTPGIIPVAFFDEVLHEGG